MIATQLRASLWQHFQRAKPGPSVSWAFQRMQVQVVLEVRHGISRRLATWLSRCCPRWCLPELNPGLREWDEVGDYQGCRCE